MSSPKILVVDDTADLLVLYSTVLSMAGYQVISAASGREGLELARQTKPDLILLDVMLPDISGIEVCRQIKSDPDTNGILVVNISGRLTSGNSQAEGLNAGADGYLTKPVDNAALLAHVRALLRIKNAEEQMRRSERQFRAAFSNALDAMLISDDEGKFVDANPAASHLFGVPREDLLGRTLSNFIPPTGQIKANNLWQELLQQGEQEAELNVNGPDGSTRQVEFRAKAKFLPGCHLIVLRDVTERNQAAQELLEAHEDLERKVQQRTAELLGTNAFLKLEIENRKAVEKALRRSTQEWEQTFDAIPDHLSILDTSGKILRANKAMRQQFEARNGNVVGMDYRVCYCGTATPEVQPPCAAVFNGTPAVLHETQLPTLPGWHMVASYPLLDDEQKQWGAVSVVRDITATKEAHQSLEESEERFRLLVAGVTDYAIYMLDPSGRVVSWNEGAKRIKGYEPHEILEKHFSSFYPADAVQAGVPATVLESAARDGHFENEGWRIRKDGSRFWANVVVTALRDPRGELRGFSIVTRDISDRKRAYETRNQLLQKLVMTQEEERRRLSRELHDQMGQSLAALMLGLKSLADSGFIKPGGAERLQRLQNLTNDLAHEAHNLARDLRPTALDDLGLHTALSNYVEEWSDRAGVQVDFHSNGLLKDRLPPHIETAIYRIIQEALTNVLKHAQPTNVSVIVKNRNNRVLAIVEDDGRGFDVDAIMNSPPGERRLGLLGMQERITLLGGTLTVESTANIGTTVLASIPFEI